MQILQLPIDSTFICNYPFANNYACFVQYFKNKPTVRANYLIQSIHLNEYVDVHYFSCMLYDVQKLSNQYFDIDSDIGSFFSEIILKDKKDVITKIVAIKTQFFEFHRIDFLYFLSKQVLDGLPISDNLADLIGRLSRVFRIICQCEQV